LRLQSERRGWDSNPRRPLRAATVFKIEGSRPARSESAQQSPARSRSLRVVTGGCVQSASKVAGTITSKTPDLQGVFSSVADLDYLRGKSRRAACGVRAPAPPQPAYLGASERRCSPPRSIDSLSVAGRTQEALYAEIDLELSWSEDDLPQYERTKHVHSLHPYLGKFIPQLVEVFLHRYFTPGDCAYDPFVGSGTTLVEANAFGAASVGCDISAFNCLLSRVKTASYSLGALELGLKVSLEEARRSQEVGEEEASEWLREWYSERALRELLAYRSALARLDTPISDVARVILSRSARSARQTTHFDLDFPRAPQLEPYWCHKHRRTCRPVDEALKFLRRYTLDTIRRLRDFSLLRSGEDIAVLHDDAREVDLPLRATGIITSPPYPGLIDYHEQHRYAYELLGLDDRRDEEIGPAARGQSQQAVRAYVENMIAVFANAHRQLPAGAPVIIVVNDSKSLYPEILERSGLSLEERLTRHVNRRTGRRAGEFFEDVLVCSTR
jgi:DNA modification methylase